MSINPGFRTLQQSTIPGFGIEPMTYQSQEQHHPLRRDLNEIVAHIAALDLPPKACSVWFLILSKGSMQPRHICRKTDKLGLLKPQDLINTFSKHQEL